MRAVSGKSTRLGVRVLVSPTPTVLKAPSGALKGRHERRRTGWPSLPAPALVTTRVRRLTCQDQGPAQERQSLFISFDRAWNAVKEFMKTEGNLPTSIDWVKGSDLPLATFPDPTVRLPGEDD